MLAESIVLELCRSGALERNIEFVNGALAERRDALVEALREQIPEAEFVVPGGGYFLWLDLAERRRHAGRCSPRRRSEGVAFVAGPDFMLEGGALEPAALVRQRPRRAGRRGRRAARPRARAARREPGLGPRPVGERWFAPSFPTKSVGKLLRSRFTN